MEIGDEMDHRRPKCRPLRTAAAVVFATLVVGAEVAPALAGSITSPHAERLAYTDAAGNVRVARVDLTTGQVSGTRVLTVGQNPRWSPDASRIVFWRPIAGSADACAVDPAPLSSGESLGTCVSEVWVINADGTDLHVVARNGLKPDWSPDGRKIVYAANDPTLPDQEIMVVDSDGTHPVSLTSGQVDGEPRWSPDGAHIAFVRIQGDHPRPWSSSTGVPGSRGGFIWPSGCPDARDGDYYQLPNQPAPCADAQLDVMNADGSHIAPIVAMRHISAQDPSWSPAGDRLAFTLIREGRDVQVGIAELDVPWTPVALVTGGGDASDSGTDNYAPTWAADGLHLALTSDPDGASGRYPAYNCTPSHLDGAPDCLEGGPQPGAIWTISSDGTHRTRLLAGQWPDLARQPAGQATSPERTRTQASAKRRGLARHGARVRTSTS